MGCANLVAGMSVLAFTLSAAPTTITPNISSEMKSFLSVRVASNESVEPVTRHTIPLICSFFPNLRGCEVYRPR